MEGFFRIVGGMSFAGLGLAAITFFKDSILLGILFGFILVGIGIALIIVE